MLKLIATVLVCGYSSVAAVQPRASTATPATESEPVNLMARLLPLFNLPKLGALYGAEHYSGRIRHDK